MKNKKTEILAWILAVLPAAAVLCFYGEMPDQIPNQWSLSGEINSWSDKNLIFLLPVLSIGINLMFVFMPRIDPKKRNYEKFSEAYGAIRIAMNIFFLGMTGAFIYGAYNPETPIMGKIVLIGVGLLFSVMGNYMPKFKQNFYCGIKTPWTLSNEEVWRSTHRVAGILWFWGGLLMSGSTLLLPIESSGYIFFAVVTIISAVPIAYSYILYKRLEKNKQEKT